MKTTGIILIVFGGLSVLGTILSMANGRNSGSFGGLVFIVLGAFLISRAKQKKIEQEKKKQWEQDENK